MGQDKFTQQLQGCENRTSVCAHAPFVSLSPFLLFTLSNMIYDLT